MTGRFQCEEAYLEFDSGLTVLCARQRALDRRFRSNRRVRHRNDSFAKVHIASDNRMHPRCLRVLRSPWVWGEGYVQRYEIYEDTVCSTLEFVGPVRVHTCLM